VFGICFNMALNGGMATRKKKTAMTDAHKEALAQGRAESRTVKAYLEALESHRPKRGRKRTADSVAKRLEAVEQEMATADPLKRLQLAQERLKLQDELAAMDGDGVDMDALEQEFVVVAASYGERKGISYTAWREVGVPATTLKAAGITRAMQG
jgi:hypothetical protein